MSINWWKVIITGGGGDVTFAPLGAFFYAHSFAMEAPGACTYFMIIEFLRFDLPLMGKTTILSVGVVGEYRMRVETSINSIEDILLLFCVFSPFYCFFFFNHTNSYT